MAATPAKLRQEWARELRDRLEPLVGKSKATSIVKEIARKRSIVTGMTMDEAKQRLARVRRQVNDNWPHMDPTATVMEIANRLTHVPQKRRVSPTQEAKVARPSPARVARMHRSAWDGFTSSLHAKLPTPLADAVIRESGVDEKSTSDELRDVIMRVLSNRRRDDFPSRSSPGSQAKWLVADHRNREALFAQALDRQILNRDVGRGEKCTSCGEFRVVLVGVHGCSRNGSKLGGMRHQCQGCGTFAGNRS